MPGSSPESAELDHNAVKAPYVRIADSKDLASGGHVTKYDVRFTQPNKAHLPMPVVHTIEHSLAVTFRQHSDDVIDVSPMGCQTGFYVLVDGETDYDAFLTLLEESLANVLELDVAPFATERQCGFAASHDLTGAQNAVRDFLASEEQWRTIFA